MGMTGSDRCHVMTIGSSSGGLTFGTPERYKHYQRVQELGAAVPVNSLSLT